MWLCHMNELFVPKGSDYNSFDFCEFELSFLLSLFISHVRRSISHARYVFAFNSTHGSSELLSNRVRE